MAFKFTATQAKNFQKLIDAFEDAKRELHEFADEVYTKWEEDFENKSESWQESDRGNEAREIVDALQSFRDEIECIDTPDCETFHSAPSYQPKPAPPVQTQAAYRLLTSAFAVIGEKL